MYLRRYPYAMQSDELLAEMAGIKIEGQDKWLTLIQKAHEMAKSSRER